MPIEFSLEVFFFTTIWLRWYHQCTCEGKGGRNLICKRQFIHITKHSGPNEEPCGIAPLSSNHSDMASLMHIQLMKLVWSIFDNMIPTEFFACIIVCHLYTMLIIENVLFSGIFNPPKLYGHNLSYTSSVNLYCSCVRCYRYVDVSTTMNHYIVLVT